MNSNFFEVESTYIDQIQLLELNGYLDAHTAPKLEAEIQNSIDKGNKFILLDFENLDYISSAGLGVFMAFIEELRENGGDIKMTAMKPKVYSVFDLLGFPILFDISQTRQEAIANFETIINK